MKKTLKPVILSLVLTLLFSSNVFAAKTDSGSKDLSGSTGSSTFSWDLDADDWVSPWKDNVEGKSDSTHYVKIYVRATIYTENTTSFTNTASSDHSTSVSTMAQSDSASNEGISGNGYHSQTSDDWGSWSQSTSVTF